MSRRAARTPTRTAAPATARKGGAGAAAPRAREVLGWLKAAGSRKQRDGLLRYGIVAPKAFGVSVGTLHELARRAGRDHDLALALWETGWYEARMLTAFIDEPGRVTSAQMDRWAADFDNWAICDTLCFHLFDRAPARWRKVAPWCRRREEFVRRAGFALLACLAAHDREAPDSAFLRHLPLIERGATDERNFVKKGVSWALRLVGRRSPAVHAASMKLAARLAASPDPSARWVGGDALRDLGKPAVRKRLASRKT